MNYTVICFIKKVIVCLKHKTIYAYFDKKKSMKEQKKNKLTSKIRNQNNTNKQRKLE